MKLEEAIEIVERWQAGGFATRIADMNPAIKVIIEAAKRIGWGRNINAKWAVPLLPGETKE